MTARTDGVGAPRLVTPDLLADVAEAAQLREGVSGVRTILRELARRQPVSVRDLSRAASLPLPVVSAVCAELRSRSVVSEDRPVRLTDAATAELGGGRGPDVGVCPACDGVGWVVPDDLWPLVERQAAVEAASPGARVELDQAHCTPETAIRRALLLADEGALDGGRVLLLGDDDLLSCAIAAVVAELRLPGPEQVTVLDVDPDLLAFLTERADNAGEAARFDGRLHDLRDPLPADLRGAFDMVVTDPPYTAEGARLFVSRAADALRPDTGGDLFFSFGSTLAEVVGSAQSDLLAMGFAIRSLVPDFNDYLGASVLGGTSAMYHLRSTGPTRSLIAGRYDGDLYTADGSDRARRYSCRNCDREYVVGRGQDWATITELQAAGCACGAGVFVPGALVGIVTS